MKAWSQPEMEELNVRATAYSPKGGLSRTAFTSPMTVSILSPLTVLLPAIPENLP